MNREKVIEDLNIAKNILNFPQMLNPEMCIKIGRAINSAIDLLKEQKAIVRCKDCKYYDENGACMKDGFLTDDWFCTDGERW